MSIQGLSIKTITGPDPAKFTESTEASGPGLRNLTENDALSVPEYSSGTGSNRKTAIIKFLLGLKIIKYYGKSIV